MFSEKSYTCSFGLRTKFALSFYAGFVGLLLASFLLVHVEANVTPHPIILVPGLGGSKLEAKLNKPYAKYPCRESTEGYETFWMKYEDFLPVVRDCFLDNIRLEYDVATRRTRNSPGVSIRVPGFGETNTIEFLDDLKTFGYLYSTIDYFKRRDFTPGINIRGAPYDFRKSPSEMGDFFDDLGNLVEKTYLQNKRKSIIFVCHSLGCPVTLHFLNQKTRSWKEKYIRAFVTLGAPWEGTVKALKVAISGDNFNLGLLDPTLLREAVKTFPSLYYILPSDKFWSKDEILVKTPSAQYTVKDYKDIFNEANSSVAYNMWLDSKNITTYDLIPPEVEVHCIHGFKVDTVESLVYNTRLDDPGQPEVKYGDGDGTVNLNSLMGCLRWKGKQPQPVYHMKLKKADHMQIILKLDALRRIAKLALGG